MPFSPETQQIIAEVERLSGRPVHVEEDASLKTLAQVTPARGVSPAHFVRYQPGNPAADYLVAYKLGFVARLFSCPPEQRFDLISTPEEDRVAVAELGLTGVGEPLTTFLRSSLLTQLRTCPVSGFAIYRKSERPRKRRRISPCTRQRPRPLHRLFRVNHTSPN